MLVHEVKTTNLPFKSTKKTGIVNGEKWMELTSRMKMARFQTFWIQMGKNKPLGESRKTGQTSGTKMAFYSKKTKTKKETDNKMLITNLYPIQTIDGFCVQNLVMIYI
ncbi:hypothetical protein Hanom_Chr14g01266761 [Helianthus anomalus]